MKSDVEILYITWNRLAYTEVTLPRVLEAGGDVDYRVYIVDNGSTDGTVEYLRSLDHPRVSEIVFNDDNLGISPVANAFWARSRAGYLGKVDNDIMVPDRWLEPIMRVHAAGDPNVGVVGITHFSRDEIDELGDDAVSHNVKTLADGTEVFVQPYIGGACHAFPRALYETFGEVGIFRDDLRSGWTQKQQEQYRGGRFPCYVYPWVTCLHLGDPRHPELPNIDPPESEEQQAERKGRHQALLLAPEPGRDWDAAKEAGAASRRAATARRRQVKRSATRTPSSPADDPLVSVILNSYNYERYLPEAIESVLAQTYKHWELVIIDDASTDSSPSIIEEYVRRLPHKVRAVNHTDNRGVSASYNEGLGLISGAILSDISSDDVWPADSMEQRVRFFQEHPDVDFLATDFDVIDAEGTIHEGDAKLEVCPQFRPYFEVDFDTLYDAILPGNFMPDAAIAVNLARVPVGELAYDENCPLVSDWDLYLRVSRRYRWGYLPASTARYRWHGENMSWPEETWERDGEVIAQRLYILGKELTKPQTIEHKRAILKQIGMLWRKYSVRLPVEEAVG